MVSIITFLYATDVKTLRALALTCRSFNTVGRSDVVAEALFHQLLRAISRSLAYVPTQRRRRQPATEQTTTLVSSDVEGPDDDREQFAGYPSWFVRQRILSWHLRWRHAVLWAFNRCVFCARSTMPFGGAPEVRLSLQTDAPDGLLCAACVATHLTALRASKRPRANASVKTFWCVVRGRDVEFAVKSTVPEAHLHDPLHLLR
jgi:hypothetical protein